METQYFKTIMVVAETRSFSRASAELCITQSAVSQRIKFMEEQYGYQLLDRSGPMLVPTEVGQLVLEKAEMILAAERDLKEELKKFSGKKQLLFCCTPTFGIAYLPAVLNGFMQKNAEVADLKLMFYSPEQVLKRLKGLKESEFDLGVVEHCSDLDLSDFVTFRLPDDELAFVSSPRLRLPAPDILLDTLLEQRLIARKEGCSSRTILKSNLAARDRSFDHFRGVITHDDLQQTIQTVVGGGGVAFVSKSLVETQLQEGTLVEHRVAGFCHNRQRTAVISRKRASTEIRQNFLDCIFAAFPEISSARGVKEGIAE